MDIAWSQTPPRAELHYLNRLLEGAADFEQQVDSYLEVKRVLADYFRVLAASELGPSGPSIQEIKDRIASLLQDRLTGRLPARLLQIRGYTSTHPILLLYLGRHVGEFVRADRLRVLTGDQVHTERRVRELRDLGFTVEARRVSGQNQYRLSSVEPNLREAARYQLRKNLEDEGNYSAAAIALLQAEVS